MVSQVRTRTSCEGNCSADIQLAPTKLVYVPVVVDLPAGNTLHIMMLSLYDMQYWGWAMGDISLTHIPCE